MSGDDNPAIVTGACGNLASDIHEGGLFASAVSLRVAAWDVQMGARKASRRMDARMNVSPRTIWRKVIMKYII